jgi:hypothetical protein
MNIYSHQTKLCKKCYIVRNITEYSKDKSKPHGLSYTCKICRKAYNDNYHPVYFQKNKRKIADYARNKRQIDSLYRLKCNIRSLIKNSFIKKGHKKSSKTEQILGCTIQEFINHLESKFYDDMSWDNYGIWEIDHIIPLATATTKESVLILNHYTNLQPLWRFDNRQKWHKLDWKPD